MFDKIKFNLKQILSKSIIEEIKSVSSINNIVWGGRGKENRLIWGGS